jgi:hypothetical protein
MLPTVIGHHIGIRKGFRQDGQAIAQAEQNTGNPPEPIDPTGWLGVNQKLSKPGDRRHHGGLEKGARVLNRMSIAISHGFINHGFINNNREQP